MPNSSDSTTHRLPDTVHRTVRLRLYPGDAETGALLAAIAGACRYVWNHMLADCEWRYARWKEMHGPALNWPAVREGKTAWAQAVRRKMGPGPSTSFFTLGRRFTELRNDPDHAWLKAYPYAVVRYSLKYLADAYARYKADPANAGQAPVQGPAPYRAGVHDAQRPSGWTGIACNVPKVGWLRLAGSDPYAGCRPLTVRVRMEGTEQHPKWHAHVCYEVPAEQVKHSPYADGALGLDRNVGQATDSEGTVYAMPDTDKLDARIARKQRELSRKQGWGPKDRRPKIEPGPARERAVEQAAAQGRAPARRCHASGQPQAGGHGAHRGGGGSGHEGHGPSRPRARWRNPARQVKQKSGLNRSHPGQRLGLLGAQAGVQGRRHCGR